MISWYTNYIINRSCYNQLGNASLVINFHKDTPQGELFSFVARNLALNDLLSAFDNDPALAIGFANDSSLLVPDPDPFTLAIIAQTSIKKVVEWEKCGGSHLPL
jgi:hypothetical protein